jgi:oligosaccharide repeat unit polymerase
MRAGADEARAAVGAGGLMVPTHLVVVGAYPLLAWTCSSLGLPEGALLYWLSVYTVVLCAWCLGSWYALTGSLFDIYGVFFLTGSLFNAGHALLEALRLNEAGILNGMFGTETTVRTLILVTVGLAALHLGALLGAGRGRASPGERVDESAGPRRPPGRSGEAGALRLVGWGLLAVSALPSVAVLRRALSIVLTAGYMGLYQQQEPTGLAAGPQILADYLMPAAIFLGLGSEGRRLPVLVSVAVVISHALIKLFLGYRAFAIMPVIAFAWAFHRSVRRIPTTALLGAGCLVLFVVFPLVRAFRDTGGSERSSWSALVQSLWSVDNPCVAILAEMGGSMGTVAYTLELVPSSRDYDLGVGYLYALTTVLPNVFGDLHPAVARGTASDWLIWTVDPYTAARGGGIGFSFIAEAYMNFGWLGAPVFLAGVGYGLAALAAWARGRDLLRVAFVACFWCFLSHYARGEAITVVRPLVWYALLPALAAGALSGSWSFAGPAAPRAAALAGSGGEESGHERCGSAGSSL